VSGPQTSPTSASSETPVTPDGAQPPAEQASEGPAQPSSQRPIQASRRFGLVVFGLLTVVYGLLVMSLRPAALASVAVLAGIALIVGGVVGLGLWAIGSPGRELLLLVNVIGIYLIIVGIDAIVAALTAERSDERARAGAHPAR
jgi:uncharacterized membrane protein HdeD (DUF308 family)